MKTGQNKFDDDIRQKLNSREIQPTTQAWDRLDAMLAVGEGEKKKSNINWLYIAAGFVGLLLLATVFFMQSRKDVVPENEIAVEENHSHPQPAEANDIPELQSQPDAVVEANSADRQPKKINHSIQYQPQKLIAVANQSEPKPAEVTSEPVQIEFQSSTNQDLLADAATSAIQSNSKGRVSVDVETLLSQVDGELEQSFREKVITKVGRSLNEVKVALSARNQE